MKRRILRYGAIAVLTLVLTYLLAFFAWYQFIVYRYKTIVEPHAASLGMFWNNCHASSPQKLVVLGDSTAYGVGASTAYDTMAMSVYKNVSPTEVPRRVYGISNLSVIGARLADVVDQQLPQAQSSPYGYMFIAVGANDATHLTPLSSYRQNLVKLFDYLKTRPPASVFMTTTPDMMGVAGLMPGYNVVAHWRGAEQNRILKELAPPSVVLVDIYQDGKLDSATHPEYYADDFFHPSNSGYAVWCQLIETTAAAHLKE